MYVPSISSAFMKDCGIIGIVFSQMIVDGIPIKDFQDYKNYWSFSQFGAWWPPTPENAQSSSRRINDRTFLIFERKIGVFGAWHKLFFCFKRIIP